MKKRYILILTLSFMTLMAFVGLDPLPGTPLDGPMKDAGTETIGTLNQIHDEDKEKTSPQKQQWPQREQWPDDTKLPQEEEAPDYEEQSDIEFNRNWDEESLEYYPE